jgi:hypothetical protein
MSREHEAKSHNGVYLGTVGGTAEERAALAQALQDFYDAMMTTVSRVGVYADVSINLKVADGRVVQADVERVKHFRPAKK